MDYQQEDIDTTILAGIPHLLIMELKQNSPWLFVVPVIINVPTISSLVSAYQPDPPMKDSEVMVMKDKVLLNLVTQVNCTIYTFGP